MTRRRKTLVAVVAAFVVAGLVVAKPVVDHARAAAVLTRLAGIEEGALANFGRHPIEERSFDMADGSVTVRARYYVPVGVTNPPGVVVLHGVHRSGIDEPRLVKFARTFAAEGILVLTPELEEVKDYRIEPRSLGTIQSAVKTLSDQLGSRRVGVMGLSFAGGLALRALGTAPASHKVGAVLAIGAHHDLERVLRFFATGTIPRPDGTVLTMPPHEYGPFVLVYSHAEDFFPVADVPAARESLRAWLREDRDGARTLAASLSPEGREILSRLFDGKVSTFAPRMLAEAERYRSLEGQVSPSGHLGDGSARVFLLHGDHDSVIPPTETLWLAKEVPEARLGGALVSPVLTHVELGSGPKVSDRLDLVRLVASYLVALDAMNDRR
ncbi:MAG: hypothetical protein U0169_13540 [Polyangiaceae bacterium]